VEVEMPRYVLVTKTKRFFEAEDDPAARLAASSVLTCSKVTSEKVLHREGDRSGRNLLAPGGSEVQP